MLHIDMVVNKKGQEESTDMDKLSKCVKLWYMTLMGKNSGSEKDAINRWSVSLWNISLIASQEEVS